MDQNKAMRSHLSPCRGLEARRRWYRAAAARPTVLVVAASVAAALLMAGFLFGVRLTPSGGNTAWVSAGVRDVLKAGTYAYSYVSTVETEHVFVEINVPNVTVSECALYLLCT